jgi:hypothetical protein
VQNAIWIHKKKHSTVHPLVRFTNHMSHSLNKICLQWPYSVTYRKLLIPLIIIFCYLNLMLLVNVEMNFFGSKTTGYLSNRKQVVSIEGNNISLLGIILGVPSGANLGPL